MRLFMNLGTFAPAFVLLFPFAETQWQQATTLALATLPMLMLCWYCFAARRVADTRGIHLSRDRYEDKRIAAVLLAAWSFSGTMIAGYVLGWSYATSLLIFAAAVARSLDAHSLNLVWTLSGYYVFRVTSAALDKHPYGNRRPFYVITKHHTLPENTLMFVYRLSNSVYLERETNPTTQNQKTIKSAVDATLHELLSRWHSYSCSRSLRHNAVLATGANAGFEDTQTLNTGT